MYTRQDYDPTAYRRTFDSLFFWGGAWFAEWVVGKRYKKGWKAWSTVLTSWGRATEWKEIRPAIRQLVKFGETKPLEDWLRKNANKVTFREEFVLGAPEEFRDYWKQAGGRMISKARESWFPFLAKTFRGLEKLNHWIGFAAMFDVGLQIGKAVGRAIAAPVAITPIASYRGTLPAWQGREVYTARQRALAQLHDSQSLTRAAFGTEAAYFHG